MVNGNNDDDTNDEENNAKLNRECLNCSGDQTKLASTSPLKENTACNSFLNMDKSVTEVQRENINNEKASTSHAPKIEDLNNILSQEKSVLIETETVDY